MKECKKCGYEMGDREMFCPKCGERQDEHTGNSTNNDSFKEIERVSKRVKTNNYGKVKKKDSPLSFVACVLAGVAFIFPLPIIISIPLYFIAFILAVVDFGINNKTQRHIGSGVAIIFCVVVAIMMGCQGVRKENKDDIKDVTTTETTSKELIREQKTEEKIRWSTDKSLYTSDTTYERLARNPDKYIGKYVKYTGTITQIIQVDEEYSGFRMNVDDDYKQNLVVVYEKEIIDYNLLEDDEITIYGVSMGTVSYDSVLGGEITVPSVQAVMIDFNKKESTSVSSSCSLEMPQFPMRVSCLDYEGMIETTVEIEKIDYTFEKDYSGTYTLTLNITGSKVYEKENLKFVFNFCSYKIYDEQGYIVDDGTISFRDINTGDKFKNVTVDIGDLPAGNYRLELIDYR